MTTYTAIANASLAVGGIPSSTTVTLLRDNPIAMAEAANGAPINVAGWHPVDKVTVGDGKNGIIYDSTANGAVASVITPDFVNGYEYRVVCVNLLPTSSAVNFIFEVYKNGAYRTVFSGGSISPASGNVCSLDASILMARVPSMDHIVRFTVRTAAGTETIASATVPGAVTDVCIRARIRFSSGSVGGGKVYLFQQREFASSP